MSKSIHATLAPFFAKTKGEVVKSVGRGRPVSITISELANQYHRTLPKGARAVAETDPFGAIEALNSLRRPLTQEETEYLAQTSDAKFDGSQPFGQLAFSSIRFPFM